MSPNPITVQGDDTVFEAMLSMLRNNIHHLPVVKRRRPIGLINLSDIIKYESQSSLYLVSAIYNKKSVAELQALLPDVRATFVRMARDEASAHMIGSAMSGIGRSFKPASAGAGRRRTSARRRSHTPFMALGSMARDEQLVVSDQDNALVLDDSFDPALHDDYFFQTGHLRQRWPGRLRLHLLQGRHHGDQPEMAPAAVGLAQILYRLDRAPQRQRPCSTVAFFFDLDAVYGESALVEELQELLAERASSNEPFLAALARNALNRTPPLGIFRTFVMEKDGRQRDVINLKRRGTAPLSRSDPSACTGLWLTGAELVRATGCHRRHQVECRRNHWSGLRYALEFLSLVRIRHQAMDIEDGHRTGQRN